MPELLLPASGAKLDQQVQLISIKSEGAVVIVGANGSGKTRLGTWMELDSQDQDKVIRISAQKSLSMPKSAASASIDLARSGFLYGYPEALVNGMNPSSAKRSYKYNNAPATFLLSDYEQLLTYLFSEENQSNRETKVESRENPEKPTKWRETHIDIVDRIWGKVITHRKLKIGGGKIETEDHSSEDASYSYNASEMSDGERVIFYLIGKSLAAPEDGIVIVDEPELHLHRSAQARLWDAIETERPDCLFVYLTHDLDFAASRVSATKVWLEKYDGSSWVWHEIQQAEEIPERLYLEIIGGRKPVIFCEGDKGSLDYFLFQKAYPDFTIAPCSNSRGVIGATGSFAAFKHMHRHDCFGIVDRDFRSDKEVNDLRRKGIFALDYSEIENVLLSEEVLKLVAQHQCFDDIDDYIETSKQIVLNDLENEKERLISSITATKIERLLRKFNSKAKGKEQLESALSELKHSVDVNGLYDETAADIEKTLSDRDYEKALKIYNNKGLLGKVQTRFGFGQKGMVDLIKRLASSKNSDGMVSALRKQLPDISS